MLLDWLAYTRSRQKPGRDYPSEHEKEAIKYPFELIVPAPRREPIFYDKIKLMELGLDDLKAEILLVLWAHKKPIPLRNSSAVTDLCDEIGMPFGEVLKQLEELGRLELITWVSRNPPTVSPVPPKEVREKVGASLGARLESLKTFLDFKQREYEKMSTFTHDKLFFHPVSKVLVDAEVKEKLIYLSLREKIVSGFLVGAIDFANRSLLVQDCFPVKTRSGDEVHFQPVWSDFNLRKRKLIESGLRILGEFHTHPDGDEKLKDYDYKVLQNLGTGFWMIVTKHNLIPFWYSSVMMSGSKKVTRLRLEVLQ